MTRQSWPLDQRLTLAEVGQRRHRLLYQLPAGPARSMAIVEDDRPRYVRVLATPDGSLDADATSDSCLTCDNR